MSSIAEISLWFLWLLVIVLYLLVLLLYRQWGLSLVRPSELVSRGGLDIGARVPGLSDLVGAADSAAVTPSDGWASTKHNTLALFVIPNCPVCTELKDELGSIEPDQKWPDSRLVVVQRVGVDDAQGVQRSNGYLHIRLSDLDGDHFAGFDIQQAPFAYVISADERVRAKGIVNTIDALDALLSGAESSSEGRKEAHSHDDA